MGRQECWSARSQESAAAIGATRRSARNDAISDFAHALAFTVERFVAIIAWPVLCGGVGRLPVDH